jgi:hypothetical protein
VATRDEFSLKTKALLAGRAGHVCSNPDCRLPTSGAALGNEGKVVTVGIAAHITAAAPGGPRYDPLQASEERSHLSNGIWLCTSHAKQIDDDPAYFTIDKLRAWKHQAEQRSALAILTREASGIDRLHALAPEIPGDLAHRLGLPPTDTVTSVAEQLCQAAARDIVVFFDSLKSPAHSIPLGLRLIKSGQVTTFEAAGLAAAIRTFTEIVLVAAPGTGKTTTLLQVTRCIVENERRVAVFIPLSEWSAQSSTLLQTIVKRRSFAGMREEHLNMIADAGQLVLVLDGWNELDAVARRRLHAEILGLRRDYPEIGFIVSTRIQLQDTPVSGPTVEIEALSESQQILIARTYRGDDGERLLDQAWRTPGLRDLVAIPLYLTKLLSDFSGGAVPTTKEGVLRLFVAEVDRDAVKVEALHRAIHGFHSEVLSAMAEAVTNVNGVCIQEDLARSVVSKVSGKLVANGQIGIPLSPDAVLTALASCHVLVRTDSSYAFQHQQFQEWFASYAVEHLMLAAAGGDEEARQRLRLTVLNEYSWEESVLFACERTSRGNANALSATASMVLDVLAIDPMLAAEAIRRSSECLWAAVKDRVLAFVGAWHVPNKVDRGARFMIKTGRPEFAEAIWSFIESPDDQIYLEALRVGGGFQLSVLGGSIAERICRLPTLHRSHVLAEFVMYGGIEGIEAATEIAATDDALEVKIAVLEALHFRQAIRQLERLLLGASDAVWRELARRGYFEETLPPEIARRLRQEAEQLNREEPNSVRKLRALIRQTTDRAEVIRQISLVIESDALTDKEGRSDDAILDASRLYPQAVRDALITRLTRRMPLPFRAENILRDSGVFIDDGAIAELVLMPSADPRLANAAAFLLGPETTGMLIDSAPAMRERIRQKAPTAKTEDYFRLLGLISLTPVESFATAVLRRASTSDPRMIELLADLVARHGERSDRASIKLDGKSREKLAAVVAQWIDTLLADELTSRRVLGEVARVIERLPHPNLAAPLARMVARDLTQWRQQRNAWVEARANGAHNPASEASHSWTMQYGRALAAIGNEEAISTLRSYLRDTGFCGFGIDAARAMREIWIRQEGITEEGLFRGPPEFSGVRVQRIRRQSSGEYPTSAIAEDIFKAVDCLLQRKDDKEALAHSLRLAAIGFSIPHGDKRSQIEQLIKLDQPYSAKLEMFVSLVKAGELIGWRPIAEAIDSLFEDAKAKPWLLQENQGTIDRWLVVLSFSDRPEALLEILDRLGTSFATPWRLRPLLSALGFSPLDSAERVLLRLAQQDGRFVSEHSWLAAIESRGTQSSLRILFEMVCLTAGTENRIAHDTWDLGRRLAAGMSSYPEFRADVYARMSADMSPQAQAIFEFAISESADEDGVLLLVTRYAGQGRPFGPHLAKAIERIVIKHRPSEDWIGAYDLISAPAASLRKRLFAVACAIGREQAELATACLIYIDELRDRYEIVAIGEPRHPDLASGAPWPLYALGASGDVYDSWSAQEEALT